MSTLSTFGGAGVSKWVSGTTYPLDTIVWSPVNYLTYVRTVAGAGTTDPSSDSTNWALFGPSKIKSVQRGVLTSGNGAGTTVTATITAVNTAKSELRILGTALNVSSATTVQASNTLAHIALTNSTTITATRYGTSWDMPISYEVTEWW